MTTLLTRDQVPSSDTWDLTPLYGSDAEWELALKELQSLIPEFARFRGTLGEVSALAECLAFDSRVDQICERLGIYSYLKTTEDVAQSTYQDMQGRLSKVLVRASEEASYIRPEIMAIDGEQMNQMLADDLLVPYRLLIERMRRYKPHTLSEKEEQILAMQGEVSAAPGKIFRQLLDADMKFGHVKNEEGQPIELTNATLMQLLISPKRSVRKKAFQQYYQQFVGHENTLAATLASSVQKDVFHARVRKYASALDAALFADDVPRSVYDNLITAVHNKLPALYRYYDIRRRKMKLKEIHHYDTYVPILSDIKTNYTWSQAVDTTLESLRPLGDEYCQVLADGLHGRWCDRYPNKGKQSGAFSYGVYCAHPYIMMNYKPEVLDDMFTLTHEAGHAMHSYYSARQQPFEYYNYVIFVAEVASTFN
ncbi:MAG: oligoendopeptidase F family protein, partial [Planctomycetales bacterium]|nr:oligoendopeptidase F family protein [Planctomycetales bacterium]